MTALPGPRWRGLSLTAAAERLGVSPAVTHHAADARRLATRRRGRVRYVTRAELRRFAATPACWAAVHPREIVDPDLRAAAVAAWEAAGAPALYAAADLARRYHIGLSTVARWRGRGWPAPGAWHWHGGRRAGDWWLVWPGALPPPPARRRPGRRAWRTESRRRVLDAVRRLGPPPPHKYGREGYWRAVADAACVSASYACRLYREREQNHG